MKKAGKELDILNLLDNLPSGVVVHEMDTSIVYANEEALRLLRLTWDQAIGKKAIDPEWNLICENGKKLSVEEYPINRIIKSLLPIKELVIGIVNKNNEPTWVVINGYIDYTNEKQKVIITFTDITERFQLPFQEIVDKARDAVVVTEAGEIDDPDGPKIVYVNDLFCKFTGYSKEEVLGKTPRILQGEDTDRETLDRIRDALIKKVPIRETIINYNKQGEPYWLDISIFPLHMNGSDEVTHFAAIERDVSESKKQELEHFHASINDPLTGLLNRRGFDQRYNELPDNTPYSIIALDIDHFKNINDTYGHTAGDNVLKAVSKIYLNASRENDLCVRFGGEEFIILLPNTHKEDAFKIAQRINLMVENNVVEFNNTSIKFTLSAGVAVDNDGTQLEDTIKKADEALYKAKENGRNQIMVYS